MEEQPEPKLGLPSVIDEYNLCALLGFSGKYPWYVVHNTPSCYLRFWLDKDTKKIVPEFNEALRLREINAPTRALKELQGRLAMNIFNKLPKHEANFAYMKGKNIKMAAEALAGNGVLIRIDLKEFFPSHRSWYIRDKLHELTGYSKEICWFISKLCTLSKQLPQGAVTSPVLSIVLNYEIDCALEKLAAEYGLVYARYADDLCFAGDDRNNERCWDFIHKVKQVVRPFKINWDKVDVMRNRAYRYVHAIEVSNDHYDVTAGWAKETFSNYIVAEKAGGTRISKLGHEELYPAEIQTIIEQLPFETNVKLDPWYVQSIQRMLGLHLTAGVKYPRQKYNRMRVEAMRVGKGDPDVNPHKFRGKLAFMRMVDPDKAAKIDAIVAKYKEANNNGHSSI